MSAPKYQFGLIAEFESSLGAGDFAWPCGFTGPSLNIMNNKNENQQIADCSDPLGPFQIVRTTQSKDWKLSGDGLLTRTALEMWQGWLYADDTRTLQIMIMDQQKEVRGYFTAVGTIASVTYGNQQDNKRVTYSIDVQAAGPISDLIIGLPTTSSIAGLALAA